MNRLLAIGTFVLLGIALAIGQLLRNPGNTPPTPLPGVSIAFRLVANADETAATEVSWRGKQETVRVLEEVVVDESGIESAALTPSTRGGQTIVLRFKPTAADNLLRASTANVGRQMAIIVDGKVLMAPAMRAPMSDSVSIEAGGTSGFSDAEARDFVERLLGRLRGE